MAHLDESNAQNRIRFGSDGNGVFVVVNFGVRLRRNWEVMSSGQFYNFVTDGKANGKLTASDVREAARHLGFGGLVVERLSAMFETAVQS